MSSDSAKAGAAAPLGPRWRPSGANLCPDCSQDRNGRSVRYGMISLMLFTGSELRSLGLTVVAVVAAAATYYAHVGGSVAPFVISGVALALLASLVGRSVEALGGRLGAG